MRGRKPTPTYLQVVAPASKRKRAPRDGAPAAACDSLPHPPAYLSPIARERWLELAPELARLNLLSTLDRDTFAAYCLAYAAMVAAERELATLATLVVDKAYGSSPHPLVSIARHARQEVSRLAAEFGMTPNSRSRLRASALPTDDKDPAKRFLG
jgi:P27 family predicted phage terminase small subunit